jgi:signal transduction histidine kinase
MVDAQRGNPFTGPFVAVVAVALLLFAMAFLWRRKMSVLDLWLLLTLWTWLVELIVLATTTVRFSFNWYAGFLLELASTTFILAGLLSQTFALYARLALATAVQRRERDSRRHALNAALDAVAHETYQPITAIAANSSAGLRHLGRDAPDLDEVHDIFNDIIADTRRTSDAIDAIRGIFKVDVSARAALAVEGLVQEVLSMVKSELRAHNVTADVSFEEGLPEIAGNREQLQQVLLNLIANAIEAMDGVTTRPRRLQVWAVKEGNEVLVTLRDSGPGIDPAQAGQIFDPFTTTKPRGSGLGLSICRSIIEAHAGRMRAASAVPHGAVFGFTLPVAS